MIERNPGRYARYADGMPGGPDNPLGARALYFYQGERDTAIRIHGTLDPSSIGAMARTDASGCTTATSSTSTTACPGSRGFAY
jgi:lipoprotein-anchoring transpeptidase ErfK/SrfK